MAIRKRIREWALRLGLLAGSLLFTVIVLEIVVRLFFPLYGGRDNVTLDGRRIKSFLEPGVVYRQVSNEYDAITTITDKGYRAPAVDGNPDVLFVGDSFTFGYGLSDDQTFASIYCKQRQLRCVNLGMPGSGTDRQVARLREYLNQWNWKPREVKLFFFGMSNSFSAGNDFLDNYNYGRALEARALAGVPTATAAATQRSAAQQRGWGERVISWQSALLENVHLMRRAKYHWGPMLRSLVLAEPGEQRAELAYAYTSRGLGALHELSRQFGFSYEIYLVVPSHDILMGTDEDTLRTLNRLSPRPAVTTAPLFRKGPQQYYFSYDGHLNPTGSRRIAEFLIERDTQNSVSR